MNKEKNIIILNPGIVIETEIRNKEGDIKEKSEEKVDLVIDYSNGRTVLKHQFKNPKEMGNGDILTLAIES